MTRKYSWWEINIPQIFSFATFTAICKKKIIILVWIKNILLGKKKNSLLDKNYCFARTATHGQNPSKRDIQYSFHERQIFSDKIWMQAHIASNMVAETLDTNCSSYDTPSGIDGSHQIHCCLSTSISANPRPPIHFKDNVAGEDCFLHFAVLEDVGRAFGFEM